MIARPPLAVPLLALLALALLTTALIVDPVAVARVDAPVSEWLRVHVERLPVLVAILRVVTDLAATVPFLAAGAGAAVLFAARADRVRAAFCALVTVLTPVGWALGQWLLHRPRPVDGFITVTANGFPSGHTSNAAAAALAVVLLTWSGLRPAGRTWLVVTAAVTVIGIAGTRLVLLAHWPVDVVGGVLFATVVVSAVARSLPRKVPGGQATPDSPPGKVSSRDG
ncbi:phosphatase PAP2 family protein [Solwaraspora sp. WMMD406]|uniref:phosphatase PAP2 family protein n=1 Tax=Solwaraspora sp. WMMD406 TaxID=3016095 RepID=UPI0024176625|nr:phosphatase PAP2 family protein [Solwaraspora sp. WMMD406]MDG4764999.1 phosphatase PAP2 family protein [Solwaraspora sp. WMMD406]